MVRSEKAYDILVHIPYIFSTEYSIDRIARDTFISDWFAIHIPIKLHGIVK